jgi:SpoVK/Ycf46/Vps4 family AAA+-type ATPase
MVTQEEWETLANSYTRFFQFAKSLEKGIHAFNQAADDLTNEELDEIRTILKCIAEQWDDNLNVLEKEASMNTLRDITKKLGESERKVTIKDIFDSLSIIPPDETEKYRRPRTIKSPRRYP